MVARRKYATLALFQWHADNWGLNLWVRALKEGETENFPAKQYIRHL